LTTCAAIGVTNTGVARCRIEAGVFVEGARFFFFFFVVMAPAGDAAWFPDQLTQ
jgi:hypothetical protein